MRPAFLTVVISFCSQASQLEISDLGRGSSIGALYDAVNAQFLDVSLWPNSNVTAEVMQTIPANYAKLSFTHSEKFEDRASLQNIDAEATASIMGGFLSVSGSVQLLEHKRSLRTTAEVVANYHIETRRTTINMHDPRLCESQLQVQEYPALKRATHVVTGIIYGGDCSAIFSAESKSSYEKSVNVQKIEGKIDFFFGSYTETLADKEDSSESSTFSSNIRVELFGDILPDGNLPTNLASALQFMSTMPRKMMSEGDLPKKVFLTPISELPCGGERRLQSARLTYATLPQRFVSLSLGMLEDLDAAEQCLNKLVLRHHRGFPSLRQNVQCQLDNLKDYRKQFGLRMQVAMQDFRSNGDEQVLDHLVQSFYDSGYSLPDTESICSRLETLFSTADDLDTFMQASELKMASHMSDFISGSWDPQVEFSYMLIFVGEPSISENRDGLNVLQQFAKLAGQNKSAQNAAAIRSSCGASGDICDQMSFTAIQFNSFCLQFCRAEQCRNWCVGCEELATFNSSVNESFRQLFDKQASWCEAPQTSILLSRRNMLPKLIPVQQIQTPKAVEVTAVQVSGSEVDVFLNESSCDPVVIRHILRLSWEVSALTEGGTARVVQQEDYEIYPPEDAVQVRLDVGRVPSFQLAAVSQAGVGPFSSKRKPLPVVPASVGRRLEPWSGMFGLPVPVVGRLGSREAVLSMLQSQQNRAPSWRYLPVTIVLSSEAKYEISEVRFSDSDGVHENFTCVGFARSFDLIHCNIPVHATSEDILWTFETIGAGRRVAERGVLLQEAPSIAACREWDQAAYCNSIRPACVRSCEECKARPHTVVPPNCSAGEYWAYATINSSQPDPDPGATCPNEPEPYWGAQLGHLRRIRAIQIPEASLSLNVRLYRNSGESSSCQAASPPALVRCSREVFHLELSPIQQLRSGLNSSTLLLAAELLLLVTDPAALLADPLYLSRA